MASFSFRSGQMISRRGVLLGATATGAALLASRSGLAAAGRFAKPLGIPPLLEGVSGTDGKVYDLNVISGKSEFLSGVATPTLGINGAYLGPTIRCGTGDHVTMRVRNNLTEPTTLHWHGLHLPAASDGGPHQVIEPGTVWETSFAIKQAASLCWYHSHLMEQTGEQVLRGLAGLFLIEDEQSGSLGLPSDYGVDDIPLVIQDRRFSDDGSFDYDLTMHDVMMGYKGNVVLVNGTTSPHVVLRRQRTRLRILNGSNSRIYTLGRDDGTDLVVIGSDGGLLEQPERLRRVRLGPGERLEILVEMQSGQSVRLMSYPDRVAAGGMGPGMMMGGMAGNGETFPVIELRAEKPERPDRPLPERLIHVPGWNAAQAARTRTFSLDMPMMGMGGMGGAGMGGAGTGAGCHSRGSQVAAAGSMAGNPTSLAGLS